MIVLGIETSCDETSVAVVNEEAEVLSQKTWSQYKEHQKFGGIIPEISARAHIKRLPKMIQNTIEESNISLKELSAISATSGPGLIGSLIIGTMIGKSISSSLGKPFLAINHLTAHALTPRMSFHISFPYLLLLTSGAHCQLIVVQNATNFKILGTTLDDAAGETFDKIARSLGLPYPGGPQIEIYATQGDENKICFPVPKIKTGEMNFSFSGLKTSVMNYIKRNSPIKQDMKFDIASSVQKTICDIFEQNINVACKYLRRNSINVTSLVISGGVAANKKIRSRLTILANKHNLELISPPPDLCTDNGAMIAWAGIEKLKILPNTQDILFNPRSRWNVEGGLIS
jgi:N6-L-threonylcarbamoyladenine synthase